jgi:aryl-alcohol dehydrogenase-like predicted oxidoreductase
MGADAWDPSRDAPWRAALRRSLELGTTHLDTAQGYGEGHSEELVGEVTPEWGERAFVATKLHLPDDPAEIPALVDGSRKRLRLEAIDLYYIHWPRRDRDLRPYLERLQREREAGRIHAVGASNFSTEELRQGLQAGPIAAHQFCYNLLWRKADREMLSFCRENGIAGVAYSPLALGLLTGKYGPVPALAAGDQRRGTVFFHPEVYPRVYPFIQEMKALAAEAGRPLEHLALKWLLAQPGITVAIAGARDAAQAEANFQASQGAMDRAVLDRLTEISDRAAAVVPDWASIYHSG